MYHRIMLSAKLVIVIIEWFTHIKPIYFINKGEIIDFIKTALKNDSINNYVIHYNLMAADKFTHISEAFSFENWEILENNIMLHWWCPYYKASYSIYFQSIQDR